MTTITSETDAEWTAVEDYPPLLPPSRSRQAMKMLRNSETLARAGRMIAAKGAELRGGVLELVEQLERAADAEDWDSVFAAAHEIRGLAGTAGLTATGRIASQLCQYLDAVGELGIQPDDAVAGLHVDAIGRSARTDDEAARHGDAVAENLAALVARRLAEIKV